MGNIVLCCDGTSNEFARHNTNAVRLYQMLARDCPGTQVCYYSPGLGTFASKAALLPITKRVARILGDSLKGWWKLAEFYLKVNRVKIGPEKYKTDLRPNFFRPRRISDGGVVHESVVMRLADLPQYRPSNLPKQYEIEPW